MGDAAGDLPWQAGICRKRLGDSGIGRLPRISTEFTEHMESSCFE